MRFFFYLRKGSNPPHSLIFQARSKCTSVVVNTICTVCLAMSTKTFILAYERELAILVGCNYRFFYLSVLPHISLNG